MKTIINSFQSFFKLEQSSGIVLICSIILAMIFANTGLHHYYHNLAHSKFQFELMGFSIINKDFHYFVNDGLMALFFFLIGLEVKREFISGELSDPRNMVLPLVGALGGLFVPMAIFYHFTKGTEFVNGWAIPAATDIAISFGVLLLLGSRIPSSLKVFLMMFAIFDDIAVIGIIAVFFTDTVNTNMLIGAAACCAVLGLLNWRNINNFAPYAIIGFILWYFVLQSGIHATLAGILVALFIPAKEREYECVHNNATLKQPSMLQSLEHSLHQFVAFGVLPIFAFINAGIVLSSDSFSNLTSDLSLGIIFGLFFGKQIGIFVSVWLVIKLGLAKLPTGCNMMQLYGVAILGGIGFTMGLFIGDLSFQGIEAQFKLPIIVGSIISAIVGLFVLFISSNKTSVKG
jgi:NhaA family Na+:H+ antiporter